LCAPIFSSKRKKGIQTDKPDEEEEESGSGDEGGAVGGTRNTHLSPGDLPPSSSSDEESSDDDLGDQVRLNLLSRVCVNADVVCRTVY